MTDKVKQVGNTSALAGVQAGGMDGLRGIADELKGKLPETILVLGSKAGDKVNFVVAVPQDLVKQGYHAGKLVKVASICGGGGGGRRIWRKPAAGRFKPAQAPAARRDLS